MFIHAYFMLQVNMKRQSVHMPFELGHNSDLSRHIKELQNCVFLFEFLTKWQNVKAETLFHTRSNLLCLDSWHVVSFLFAPQCIFPLCENMMCKSSMACRT